MNFEINFASNFSKLRRSRGMSQEYVANYVLNITQQMLSFKERGNTPFYEEEKQKLAAILGMSVDDIIFWTDEVTRGSNPLEQSVLMYSEAIGEIEQQLTTLLGQVAQLKQQFGRSRPD